MERGYGPICAAIVGAEEVQEQLFDESFERGPAIRDGHDIVLQRASGEAVANVPHRIVHHSPTGFEWGYGGSGPAELALNILGVFTDDRTAWRLHQDFKWEFIANMPAQGDIIKADTIREWIRSHVSG